MRRVLARRDMRLYVAGQTLSVFGDTALWLALGGVGEDAHRQQRRRRHGDLRPRRAAAAVAAVRACSPTACAAARC